MSKGSYDVAVIGGGAAGLCTAVSILKKSPGLSVAVLEQLDRVGKKLIVTGNGRCNITNKNIELSRYHGGHPEFYRRVLERFGKDTAEDFFRDIGVIFTYDDTGRAFPYSLQAASVVDSLRFCADALGADTLTQTRVTGLTRENDRFSIVTSRGVFTARAVVAASGLYSGGVRLGSDGSVFELLKKSGYRTVPVSPAIVRIRTVTDVVRQLEGIKVNATVTLEKDGEAVRSEYGEVLFCDYGLSGPPVLQVSRAAGRSKGNFTVVLDLMPEYRFEALTEMLSARSEALFGRGLGDYFTGMLNKRVGQAILKSCGYKLTDSVQIIKSGMAKRLTAAIKSMRFEVTGTGGFDNSQVTAGGLDTDEFDAATMMSHRDKGLFAAGELLDVDGDCGGFNLQFAWSSALCAADGVCTYLSGNPETKSQSR